MASTLDDLPESQLWEYIRRSNLFDGFTFEGVDYPAPILQFQFYDESIMNDADNKNNWYVTIYSGGDQSALPSFAEERAMTILFSGPVNYEKLTSAAVQAWCTQFTKWLRFSRGGFGCITGINLQQTDVGPLKQDAGRFEYYSDLLVSFSVV